MLTVCAGSLWPTLEAVWHSVKLSPAYANLSNLNQIFERKTLRLSKLRSNSHGHSGLLAGKSGESLIFISTPSSFLTFYCAAPLDLNDFKMAPARTSLLAEHLERASSQENALKSLAIAFDRLAQIWIKPISAHLFGAYQSMTKLVCFANFFTLRSVCWNEQLDNLDNSECLPLVS